MSNSERSRRVDDGLVILALVGGYLGLGGLDYSLGAGVVFAALCFQVGRRFDPSPLALVPLLVVPFGVYSFLDGLVYFFLLLLGSTLLHLLIGAVVAAVKILRESERGLDRIAAVRVVATPAWWCLFGGCTVLAVLEGQPVAAFGVVLSGLLVWRHLQAFAAAAALAAAAIEGWAPAPLVVAGTVLAVMAWRLSARPPRLWHPLPPVDWKRRPLTWLRFRRCDHHIACGDLLRARAIAEGARRPTDHQSIRLMFLDVEEGSYHRALAPSTVTAGREDEIGRSAALMRGRALSGIAQFDAAASIYLQLLDGVPERSRYVTYLLVLRAENWLAAGELDAARDLAGLAHNRADGRREYFLRLRSACVSAEAALDAGDPGAFRAGMDLANQDMLAGNRWIAALALTEPSRAVRQLFGRQGNLHLNFLRVEALERRGDAEAGSAWDAEAGAMAMAIGGRSDQMVEVLLAESRNATGLGRKAEGLRLAARALMELDATRYLLAAQSARTSWSRRFQRALPVALAAAVDTEDHALVAELLEFARVQALPAATAEGSADLALSTPPVVQVRGRSRLARPGDAGRPEPVALETAAVRAAGPDGWWLSFWEADGFLYWALVPPDGGGISSGRTSIQVNSELSRALLELERALPSLLVGESPASADFRIAKSPFLVDPLAEQVLSARLGAQLIPQALIDAARAADRDGRRLSLAIVPSPSLGYVPWGILAVPGVSGDFDRLLEFCDWTIAPSAALLSAAPAGERSDGVAPLALVVADTVAGEDLWPLEGARLQASALSGDVDVLGGRHWTERAATIEAVVLELEDAGPDITAAFMCHAVRGTPDEPSRGGLVMAGGETEVLSPVDLFAMSARGVPMPAQVLLQACDTSALSDAASGEWLTLAPALIAGGSREVISTLYPMPDLFVPDDPIIAAAVAGTSLRDAVLKHQRVGLIRWEAGRASDPSHTPLAWAAYASVCAHQLPGPEWVRQARPEGEVSTHFLRVIADAIKQCREGRAERLDSGYLLSAVLDDSAIAEYFDGGGHSLSPWTFIWTLGPYICARFLRMKDGATRELALEDGTRIEVSELMLEALAVGRRAAARDGVLVEPEYLLQAALERRSGARRILRFLSALSRRPFELTVRALAHSLADTIARGQNPADRSTQGREQDRLAWSFAEWPEELAAPD